MVAVSKFILGLLVTHAAACEISRLKARHDNVELVQRSGAVKRSSPSDTSMTEDPSSDDQDESMDEDSESQSGSGSNNGSDDNEDDETEGEGSEGQGSEGEGSEEEGTRMLIGYRVVDGVRSHNPCFLDISGAANTDQLEYSKRGMPSMNSAG